MNATGPDNRADIFTVSRLTTELRGAVEGSFPLLWVAGEISNLSRPRSGHLYFSVKDPHAQIRCALFRGKRQLLRVEPENGMQVLLRARPTVYEPRGDLQLIVEHLEPAGEGALHQAYERLKRKLDAEGLFDPVAKQPLPAFPRRVGLITSTSGAAIRDVLKVLAARFPALAVRIYPAQVQGEAAPASLRSALRLALQRSDCDLLLLTRGGGSLEDLWAFNDEGLARDIAAAKIPVVSAVGHETDFTIADFVADRRAPTPSAAAELISPDGAALQSRLAELTTRLAQRQRQRLQTQTQRLDHAGSRLQALHPARLLARRGEALAHLGHRLTQASRLGRASLEQRLLRLRQRLTDRSPLVRLKTRQGHQQQLTTRLLATWRRQHEARSQRLAALARQLDTVSPLRTLRRGYAIVRRAADGAVLRSAEQLQSGDRVQLLLARGQRYARIEDDDNQ